VINNGVFSLLHLQVGFLPKKEYLRDLVNILHLGRYGLPMVL